VEAYAGRNCHVSEFLDAVAEAPRNPRRPARLRQQWGRSAALRGPASASSLPDRTKDGRPAHHLAAKTPLGLCTSFFAGFGCAGLPSSGTGLGPSGCINRSGNRGGPAGRGPAAIRGGHRGRGILRCFRRRRRSKAFRPDLPERLRPVLVLTTVWSARLLPDLVSTLTNVLLIVHRLCLNLPDQY
jgi:hypothetical protein